MKNGFFAVDRRAWALVSSVGLNSAAAYLVIACGTGGDNRTSRWSNNAVEKYTGLSRSRAAAAVKSLQECGLVRLDEAGTRPRYYLLPAHLVANCEGHPPLLSTEEAALLGELVPEYWIRLSNRRSKGRQETDLQLARSLASKGCVAQDPLGGFSPVPHDAGKAAEPDWIWLPNTIVTGAANELPPVALLRQTQNAAAMRLFVDCYHSHGLAEDGGIHWRSFRRDYSRQKVGERGPYIVWGFQAGNNATWAKTPFVAAQLTGKTESFTYPDGTIGKRDIGFPVFWEAWGVLEELGLIEIVPHIVEADNADAEVVHPYALETGEPEEQDLGSAAHAAGESLLIPSQVERSRSFPLALLPALVGRRPNIQMVGIARMRYRPQTKATGAWIAKREGWEEWTQFYLSIADDSQRVCDELQRQA